MAAPWNWLSDIVDLAANAYSGSKTSLPPSDRESSGFISIPLGVLSWGLGIPVILTYRVFRDDHQIVFSIRGTDGLGDGALDALFFGQVTTVGYSAALQTYAAALIPPLQAYLQANPGLDLVITGHSLGGMVAEQLVQWFYDPTDPHGLTTGSRIVTGVGIGSPGVYRKIDPVPSGRFYHVTRQQDWIGTFEDSHIGPSFWIDDEVVAILPATAHNHDRYASQIDQIARSPTAAWIEADGFVKFLSPTYELLTMTVLGGAGFYSPVEATATRSAFFGTIYNDAIKAGTVPLIADMGDGDDRLTGGDGGDVLAGGAGSDVMSGGGGVDYLYGGEGVDYLYGGERDDSLEGGPAGDWLFGGNGGDGYHIGVGQGHDVIDDRGGSGTDRLILYTGGLGDSVDRSWFVPEGDDLLVQVRNASGVLLIDIRIEGMGGLAGGIEVVEVWGGQGYHKTDSDDLKAIWQEKTRLAAPPPPSMAGASPPPTAPSAGQFTYTGGSGANTAAGDGRDDVMRGLGGDDALGGGAGRDSLLGNGGDDTLNGGDDKDLLIDDDPGDLGGDYLDGGVGDDSLVFYGAPRGREDTGVGGSGSDLALVRLEDSGRDWRLTESNGRITVRDADGQAGVIVITGVETIAALFGSGDDFAHSGDQRAYFDGGGGDDELIGEGGDDLLKGGDGDDHLDGGGGEDWLDGGAGNDLAEVDLGGDGRDLSYVASDAAGATGFTFRNGTHLRNIERIDLTTGSGDDRIWLGDGQGRVGTGGGDDLIVSSLTGQDSIDGGSGLDRLVVDLSAGAQRLVARYDADDQDFEIYSGSQYLSAARRAHVIGVEEVVLRGGGGDDLLNGGAGDDELIGAGGDDRLSGGGGDNRLEGGAGDDDLTVGLGADWADGGAGDDYGALEKSASTLDFDFDTRLAASENGQTLVDGTHVRNIERWDVSLGGGDDTVIATVRGQRIISLGSGDNRIVVDHQGQGVALVTSVDGGFYRASASPGDLLSVTGATRVAILGGQAADSLVGLAGADVLDGGGGGDALYGGAGADRLRGGQGQDHLYGQGGSDTFVYEAGDSLVASYDVIYDFEAGSDHIDLTALYTPTLKLAMTTDGVSTYVHADFEGDGVWDFVILAAGAVLGIADLVQRAGVAPTGFSLFGSTLPDLLIGALGADTLSGGDGHDSVWGGAGDDVLEGGVGSDTLDGGAGTDTASYASATAGVELDLTQLEDQFTRGAGVDTLVSIENLIGSTFDDLLIGDQAANALRGWNGNDRLRSGAGDDYLDGGLGDDALDGEAGADLVYGDGGADTLSGGDGHDSVWGGAGDDVLEGGVGSDTLDGGAGTDTASYASATAGVELDLTQLEDQLTRGAGVDTLVSIENLIGSTFNDLLIGDQGANALRGWNGNDRLRSGAGDDYLDGGSGDDVLDGEAGADLIRGGGGADLLTGGAGADLFVFAALSDSLASARDVIVDFAAGDRIDLSAIDANIGLAGDQAFHKGQTAGRVGDILLAYDAASARTSLSLYADGDAVADAVIWLTGDQTGLTSANFLF